MAPPQSLAILRQAQKEFTPSPSPDAGLKPLPGFPVTFLDEIRSISAGDVDGDGKLEIVAGTTMDLDANGHTDILINDDWHSTGVVIVYR